MRRENHVITTCWWFMMICRWLVNILPSLEEIHIYSISFFGSIMFNPWNLVKSHIFLIHSDPIFWFPPHLRLVAVPASCGLPDWGSFQQAMFDLQKEGLSQRTPGKHRKIVCGWESMSIYIYIYICNCLHVWVFLTVWLYNLKYQQTLLTKLLILPL